MAERKPRRKMESTFTVMLPLTFTFTKETTYKHVMTFLRRVRNNPCTLLLAAQEETIVRVEAGTPIVQKRTTY